MLENFKQIILNPYLLVILNMFFIIATYTDIKYMKIYDKFNIVMFITRIITFFIFGFNIEFIIGGILMFLVLLSAAVVTNAQIGGDIKFSGNIGLWLGFIPSAIILAISLIINLIFRKITKNIKPIALAPFLYVSFLLLLGYVYLFL